MKPVFQLVPQSSRLLLAAGLLILIGSQPTRAELSNIDAHTLDWARTWDSGFSGIAIDVAVDQDGFVYVIGFADENCDLDPGAEEEIFPSPGMYLSKFTPSGDLAWARSWQAWPGGVDVDSQGNVVVSGYATSGMDFDLCPRPEPDSESDNWLPSFVARFSSTGDILWIATWSDGSCELGSAVACYGENVYVASSFTPAQGPSLPDSRIRAYDSLGTLLWSRTIIGEDWGELTAIEVGSTGPVYVVGLFCGPIDLGPDGGEVDLNDSGEVCLCAYAPSGDFLWIRHWGGVEPVATVELPSLCVDDTDRLIVCGDFSGEVDFDPGPGHAFPDGESMCSYVSCFDSEGNFDWVTTWQATALSSAQDVGVGPDGKIYVTGSFNGVLTLDEEYAPSSWEADDDVPDAYLATFDDEGAYFDSSVWGADGWQCCFGVAVDSDSNVYVCGSSAEPVEGRAQYGTTAWSLLLRYTTLGSIR